MLKSGLGPSPELYKVVILVWIQQKFESPFVAYSHRHSYVGRRWIMKFFLRLARSPIIEIPCEELICGQRSVLIERPTTSLSLQDFSREGSIDVEIAVVWVENEQIGTMSENTRPALKLVYARQSLLRYTCCASCHNRDHCNKYPQPTYS